VNIQDVVRLTSRKPLPIGVLCERLMVTRKELLAEVREARAAGAQIELVDGYIGTRVRVGGGETVVLGDAKPGRKLVAHVSDLHAGSRYFDREALLGFLHHAWDRGARVLVNSGDNLDGHKDVLLLEQRAVGFDAQAEELVEVWRKAPPFKVVAIDGNHDGYHSNACGFVSGKLLEARMREAKISWTFAGVCLGRAVVHGARWMMWHPHGGASTRNALRRILNARIEAMPEPLDVLVMGHFHKFSSVPSYPEGVFGFSSGTFQRKGSEFANRISNPWDIGGVLVSYDIDAKGRASHTAAEFVGA
jgi:predicted phosphodiesterase